MASKKGNSKSMHTGSTKNWQDQELDFLKGRTLDKVEYSLSGKDPRKPHEISFFFVDIIDEIYRLSICVTSFEDLPSGWHRCVGQVVSSAYKITDDIPKVLIHFEDASHLFLGQTP